MDEPVPERDNKAGRKIDGRKIDPFNQFPIFLSSIFLPKTLSRTNGQKEDKRVIIR